MKKRKPRQPHKGWKDAARKSHICSGPEGMTGIRLPLRITSPRGLEMGTLLEELHEQHKARQDRIRQAAFRAVMTEMPPPEPEPEPVHEHEGEMKEEPVELRVENRPVFDIIVDEVCAYYNIRREDMLSNRRCVGRTLKISDYRHMLIYMLYLTTKWNSAQIATKVDREPTSIGYALKKIMDNIDQYEEQIIQLRGRIAPLLARKKAALFQT